GGLGAVGLLRREVTDEQIELAVAVPVADADLGAHAAARVLRGAVAGRCFAGRHELNALGPVRPAVLCRAEVLEEPDAAVAGADEEVELAVAVPVGGNGVRVAVVHADRLAAGLELALLAERKRLGAAFVGDEVHTAADLADE